MDLGDIQEEVKLADNGKLKTPKSPHLVIGSNSLEIEESKESLNVIKPFTSSVTLSDNVCSLKNQNFESIGHQ